MNRTLLRCPGPQTIDDWRQLLSDAFESVFHAIPESGGGGMQINAGQWAILVTIDAEQAEMVQLLADAGLSQVQVMGFESVELHYVDGTDPPEYAPIITTPLQPSSKSWLAKRVDDQGVEIPKEYNWFPIYQGHAPWSGV